MTILWAAICPFTWKLVFDIPVFLLLAFFLSLAVVRVRDGKLYYRRFLRWREIKKCEAQSSGALWPPFIG